MVTTVRRFGEFAPNVSRGVVPGNRAASGSPWPAGTNESGRHHGVPAARARPVDLELVDREVADMHVEPVVHPKSHDAAALRFGSVELVDGFSVHFEHDLGARRV